MDDVTSTKYAKFLESMIGSIMEYKPEAIAVQYVTSDGSVGSYYFNCSMSDKLTMAGMMQHDATMDAISANPEWLKMLIDGVGNEE